MKTQPKVTIKVAAAALALSACGIVVGTSAGTPVAHASVVPARHVLGNTGFVDLRDLAQAKLDAAGNGVERARAQAQSGASSFADLSDLAQAKRDAGWAAVQRARAAASPDSGLAACTSLAGGQPAAASDYPKIAAQFAGSRWPGLRISGLAYVEIATQLLASHAYGGETVWFYQRLSTACAKHGRPLDF
jgi:hypothetical protein